MSWLIVGISAFQHANRPGECPRRTGNKRDPGPTGAERAGHDSGESPCVKPRRILARRSIGAHCVRRRLPAILPRLPSGASTPGEAAHVKTRLTLLDCLGIGINGIIGSGIFLLPARVFAAAGGLAWASWFAVGGVCLLVGLCFGEVASGTDRNGGPYAYARAAFGDWIGFAVGWMAFASVVLSYGAVARALGRNLSYVFPSLSAPLAQGALAASVVAALALLNWRGVKPGAVASDFFSGAKLLPLLGFVAVSP